MRQIMQIRQIKGHTYDIPGFYYNNAEYQIIHGVLRDVTNDKIMYQDAEVLRFAIVRLDAVYFVLNVRMSYSSVRLLIFNCDFQLMQSLPSHTVDFIHCANQLIVCDCISIDFFKYNAEFKFSGSRIHTGLKIMIVYRGYYIAYSNVAHKHALVVYDQNFKPYKILSRCNAPPLWMAELADGNLAIVNDTTTATFDVEFNPV